MTHAPFKPHGNAKTISDLLAPLDGDAAALGSPGRPDLSFDGLREQVAKTGEQLNGFGLGREDGIAIVLPNGAEMAAAFLGVANAATAAPLNPGYRADEFEFYLGDLDAKAVVVQDGVDSPVREAAQRLNIPLVELHPQSDGPAGLFDLSAEISGTPERPGRSRTRRRRPCVAHLGHHVTTQARAAASAQSDGDRAQHPQHAQPDPR